MTPDLVIALDYSRAEAAQELVQKLKKTQCILKIGLELFTSGGPDLVRHFVGQGHRVFLDLKLHDIPQTMSQAALAAMDLGVEFLTIHLAAGSRAVDQVLDACGQKLTILGVTVLTSLSEADWAIHHREGIQATVLNYVKQFPKLKGIVCSARELEAVRKHSQEIYCLVPGIRLDGQPTHDQARTMTPLEAKAAGASALVLGRAVRDAADPAKVLESIKKSLA